MDDRFQGEVIAACNALGNYENEIYHKDPDCQETIKDIIRYLKKDDENHEVRRLLGRSQILQNDLIHILNQYSSEKELFEVTLRLIVNLCTPALVLWEEEIPEEKLTRSYFQEVTYFLQQYKYAFSKEKIWSALGEKLAYLLNQPSEIRLEEDNLIIERILILIRNILHVSPTEDDDKRTDDDNSLHDQVIWALHKSGVEDLILFIATSDRERHLCLHILEIISLMFKEQDPKLLATTGVNESLAPKNGDSKVLQMAILREKERRKNIIKKCSTRHTRFGGAFYVKNFKSISDNDVIYHKPLSEFSSMSWDDSKKQLKVPKNKFPRNTEFTPRRSTIGIRMFLKEFCSEFLYGAYNLLMCSVKDNLVRSRSQENDETYYLWAMKFFMEFNRHYKFKINYVSETISVQTFHYIQTQLQHYHERLVSEKKQVHFWAQRMHLAIKAYQELMHNLVMMDKCDDIEVRSSSKVIKENLFYTMEYRELCFIFLLNYSETKLSREYLRDLIETCHIFIKLIEHANRGKTLIVQKKVNLKKKKKTLRQAKEIPEWDTIEHDVRVILQTNETLEHDIFPFDATSEIPIDEQRFNSKARIQNFLINNKISSAVNLLRISRNVWPGPEFCLNGAGYETELRCLKEIFHSCIEDKYKLLPIEECFDDAEDQNLSDSEEKEFKEMPTAAKEQEFNFQDFLSRFANHKIVRHYSLLLGHFETNSVFTNHCIIKMLHRISFDLKMWGMLFQASLFRTFQRALNSYESGSIFKEIVIFGKFIIGKFVEVANQNSKVYFEILFWKSGREGCELEEGYGTYQSKAKTLLWNEEEEFELERLYKEFKDIRDGENDVVDHIMNSIIDDSKSRRMIIKKLKSMGLIENSCSVTQKSKVRNHKMEWTDSEIDLVKNVWSECKDTADPMSRLLERLSFRGFKRSRNQTIDQLLWLGLIQERKAVHKKSTRRRKHGVERNSEELRANRNKSTWLPEHFSSDESFQLAQRLRKNGYVSTLEWIYSSLIDAADNDDDEEEEDIPLVTFNVQQSESLKQPDVQQFLKSIDIRPPMTDKETNWRIKSSATSEQLLARAQIVHNALHDGGFTMFDTEVVTNQDSNQVEVGNSSSLLDADSHYEINIRGKGAATASTLQVARRPRSNMKRKYVKEKNEMPEQTDEDSDLEIKPQKSKLRVYSDSE